MGLVKNALIGLLVLGLAACPDNGARQDTAATTDTVGMAAQDTPRTAEQERLEGMESVQLSALGDLEVSGEASLAPDGERTRIMVTLSGPRAGRMQGHVHQGTCDNIGSVRFPLEPVEVPQGASGSSTSTVETPARQLMDAEYVIVYHEPGGEPGQPVVCGEIGGTGVLGM